jgi:hypothetical protein
VAQGTLTRPGQLIPPLVYEIELKASATGDAYSSWATDPSSGVFKDLWFPSFLVGVSFRNCNIRTGSV